MLLEYCNMSCNHNIKSKNPDGQCFYHLRLDVEYIVKALVIRVVKFIDQNCKLSHIRAWHVEDGLLFHFRFASTNFTTFDLFVLPHEMLLWHCNSHYYSYDKAVEWDTTNSFISWSIFLFLAAMMTDSYCCLSRNWIVTESGSWNRPP